MPATTTAKFNDRTITFTEDDHSYVDDQGFTYTSVTTFLHQFFEPFDADAIAARMEAQGRGTAAAIKAEWEANKNQACEFGTRVHETAEAALRGLPPPHSPADDRERNSFRAVWDYSVNNILPHGKVIGPELLVFHPFWKLAGTIDLPVKLPNGDVWILDWKTNKAIDRSGFNGKMARGPISNFPDCNFTKYALQLNVYQQILVNAGYLPRTTTFRRALLWLNPETFGVEFIEVPDMQVEALSCIADSLVAVPF